MPTILQQLDAAFRQAISDAFGFEADPMLAVSQNEKFVDYQSNAAMGLAKQVAEQAGQGTTGSVPGKTGPVKTNPRLVAEQIKEKLNLGEMATEVAIAGPGFLNVRLSPQWLGREIATLRSSERLGIPKTQTPTTVVVDYSGVNVAKQMHVGHLRSTNIGDAIARTLEFQGQQVVRQNHIGDWGTQFGMLIAFLKWTGLGGDARLEDLEDFYRRAKQKFDAEPAFAEEARQTVVRLQAGGVEELATWKRIVDESRAHFQPLYDRMHVSLGREHERGESFYNPMLANVVKELRDKGVAVESEGAIVVWVEKFETPLIIQKRDGGYGYGTTDLAALRYRTAELGATRLAYVTDARQREHFAKVFDAAKRAGWTANVNVEHVMFGAILGADNKPIKTREGTPVSLKSVFDDAIERARAIVGEKSRDLSDSQRQTIAHAVGIGAVKYFDLNKDRTSDYVFDWEKMLSMEGNTAPYLQYAHARIKSIFRKAGAHSDPSGTIILEAPHELALAKHVFRITEIIDLVARELKPHHLTTYLYDLATKFSGFYENCPVIQSEEPTRTSRLMLCDVTARTLALGLDLLGIEHPEQM